MWLYNVHAVENTIHTPQYMWTISPDLHSKFIHRTSRAVTSHAACESEEDAPPVHTKQAAQHSAALRMSL